MNRGKFGKFGGPKFEMTPTGEDCEEQEGGSLLSKLEKFSGMWTDLDAAPVVVDTKREISKFQEEECGFPGTQNTFQNKWNRTEDPQQKMIDNQKRVQSLQQRSETLKAQHSLINSALTFDTEKKRNNHIVFNQDGDYERREVHTQVSDNDREQKSKYGVGNLKSNQLLSEKADKFVHEEISDSGEKDHQSVMGQEAPNRAYSVKETVIQNNIAFARFDYNVKDHVRYEKVATPFQETNETTTKFKRGKEDSQSLPEVSSERYYQTTKALDIGKGGDFSLRTLFQQHSPDLEVEEEEKNFRFQNEYVGNTEIKKQVQPINKTQQGYWKNAGMWHESLFFLSGDARFKEAVDFIHQTAKEEAYRDRNKWFEQREKLKLFYRNKMRRHALWVADSTQQSQKKRPLADAADESSYHFYGQQDEIERQKKKKPHRTFFK